VELNNDTKRLKCHRYFQQKLCDNLPWLYWIRESFLPVFAQKFLNKLFKSIKSIYKKI